MHREGLSCLPFGATQICCLLLHDILHFMYFFGALAHSILSRYLSFNGSSTYILDSLPLPSSPTPFVSTFHSYSTTHVATKPTLSTSTPISMSPLIDSLVRIISSKPITSPSDNPHLSITLCKGKYSCILHLISHFMHYAHLHHTYHAFSFPPAIESIPKLHLEAQQLSQ